MRFSSLEPQFLAIESPTTRRYVNTLSEAQGVMFFCPKCIVMQPDGVSVHSVVCWFSGRGVPDDEMPGLGRWQAQGTSYTFAEAPGKTRSVQLLGACGWHGYVTNGKVTTC